jgi:uncharacterized RDD family membrane protein YckC
MAVKKSSAKKVAPSTSKEVTSAPKHVSVDKKAGVVVRWGAWVMDGLIVLIPTVLLSSFILGWFIPAIYYIVTEYTMNGQTLGKRFFGMRVISTNGKPATLSQLVIRETIGKFISWLVFMLGYIWVIFDSNRQGWFDKMANTYVIETQTPTSGKNILAIVLIIMSLLTPFIVFFFIGFAMVLGVLGLGSAAKYGGEGQVMDQLMQYQKYQNIDYQNLQDPSQLEEMIQQMQEQSMESDYQLPARGSFSN